MKMKKYISVQIRGTSVMMRGLSIFGSTLLLVAVLLLGCTVEVDEKTQFIETPSLMPLPDSTIAPATPTIVTISDQPTQSDSTPVSTAKTSSASTKGILAYKSSHKQSEDKSDSLPKSDEAVVFEFVKTYVDTNYGGNGKPGWAHAGDMDQDGDMDIVAGGGRALFVYENDGSAGGWQRYGNLDGTTAMGANGGVLFDVDSDSDLDVVSAKYYSQLGWWENPGGTLNNNPWQFHAFSEETWYLHDIIVVDLDKDGKAEEFITNLNSGYWGSNIKVKWFRPGPDAAQYWEVHTIETNRSEGSAHGHAGMDVGDVDKDGHLDLAYSNGWYEAPDNLISGSWTWHQVSNIYGISNVLAEDMDGDTDLDMLVSGGHHGQGVYWLENDGYPASGSWTQHNISAVTGDVTKRHVYDASAPEHLHHPECLALADMEADGDQDVVTCDLFFGEDAGEPGWGEEKHNVYIYENLSNSLSWKKHNIAPNSYPSHLLQLADVNEDGRLDIVSESAGYSVVSYYENITDGTPVPPTGTIEGTVALQSRSDHSSAEVCADDGSLPVCVQSDAVGTYSIDVAGGSYAVTVNMERYLDGEKLNVPVIAGGVTNLPPVTCLGGDSNDDCVVNILDLSLEGGRFGTVCGDLNWDPRADINDDCIINILDLTVTAGNFNKTCPVPWG